ncbi:beta-lactamase/transpeptidase-like protein [Aspergillus sclerotiicarbonarius CBS 121057]|uniref:Beta-lactamase/transpeptidase-like protein n=1 Tax=Aspergillus sclerotiicarbonarius (strain CBS 121057 / IBT 28362) TaxID=1448318 RepID=A0A319DZT7_ASPSB|nr:beta-lactamase/transpeptidase-like protein [Aspergillus sclerotiicarbonarius CBS 121057]
MTVANIQDILQTLPSRYRGPGGAVAVVKNGELVGELVWGYADLRSRIPMAPSTRMPICSITKQMLCLILKDLERNPTPEMAKRGNVSRQLADGLGQLVPRELIEDTGLRLDHLYNNQSGIRDYWAMSMFWGTQPEGEFTLADDAKKALGRTKSLHYQPGTQYSYCNLNFHILARVVEHVSGTPLGELLAERLFSPAQMKTASLCADNARLPPPCVGYEGDESFGYIPAINRTQWSGDAGAVASLEDMVAYERYLDQAWADQQSLYREMAQDPSFEDGTPARYGYGLERMKFGQIATIGHGGAIRGFRLHRIQAPSERLSVVVMLNHQADAAAVAAHILQEALGLPKQQPLTCNPSPHWTGSFFDPDAQLVVEVRLGGPGQIIVTYTGDDEALNLVDECNAHSGSTTATISADSLVLHRIDDNRHIHAKRIIASQPPEDYVGQYHCAEVDSTFHCSGAGGMLYGSFDGFLGQGPAELMRYLGDDVWVLMCARGLDAPAPGNWTVVFQRDDHGQIGSVVFGCWLARKVAFIKQ